ncbi:isoprenoid synthase domain-containing -like, partial [Paramuricea clavata]
MVDFRVSVVLPAAGIGSRMGCDIPKQYLKILDRPLLSYTIEAFERVPWIETIVVVGPVTERRKQILENIVLDCNHKKVVTACGESTRHGSIYNGVRYLNTIEQKPDIIIIHDAVRPFIEERLLKEIVVAAQRHGACGVVRPLVSTVLARNTSGFLDHSLDRSKFVASEMPQAFQYDVILNAYRK